MPIMKFKNQEQAEKCLHEWQDRLFLNAWTISVKLVKPREIPNEAGHINFVQENKSAIIKIAILKHLEKFQQKECAEKTLIHELLHCKYNLLENNATYEGKYLDAMQHALLEEMAKSLLMAKYNLSFSWFKNREE